jgi:sensor histidine kinase YesM
LIAFFAYLAAAKIIVRKTAESEARVQLATDSAEREALGRQLVQARLKLLQAQVEPHFLFNTLAAVDYLIETDPKRASEMQKVLISYLRAALPQMRQESSTLGRELALIRPYLELLKLRIEDRLSYDIQVPAGLESTVFPPMVLQTLVENAVKHGIEPKPEGGRVTVSAQVVDGQLRVEVSDTGVGLNLGHIYAANTQGTGLGLDNIRNRLALLYPGASSLNLRAGVPVGTVVSLAIPYQAELTKKHD